MVAQELPTAAPAGPRGPGRAPVSLRVDGRELRVETEPRRTRLGLLQLDLGLAGAKTGCNLGEGDAGPQPHYPPPASTRGAAGLAWQLRPELSAAAGQAARRSPRGESSQTHANSSVAVTTMAPPAATLSQSAR